MRDAMEAVIGLEVHAELLAASKVFCACSATFGAAPNTNVCPVCLGMPGSLPVLNARAVEFAVRAGLAMGSRIASRSVFARKNYFYPDLPKGYQISQYELPVCVGGHLDVPAGDTIRRIRLTRIHMEEDAGKNLHEGGVAGSLVDYNRAGVPLLEIVSEPDLRTAEEAGAYLRTLRAVLQYLEICDGNMEEGSFRCDANVSVRPAGASALGTKVEVKNMNSFRSVERAITFEIARQIEAGRTGETIVQETRLWDEDRGETRSMRSKEHAHDYRYFPDPDLPPLVLDETRVAAIRARLPELPTARRARFETAYGLSPADADVLTQRKDVADYFEAGVAAGAAPKDMASWTTTEILRILREDKLDRTLVIHDWPVPAARLAELIALVADGTVNRTTAKGLLPALRDTDRSVRSLVEAEGLGQMSDRDALTAIVADVVARHPEQVAQVRAGRDKVVGFLVGQVMKASGGKANPQVVQELLRAAIGA